MTHHVLLGNVVFALTDAQLRLLWRIHRKPGRADFVCRGEVRSARVLASLGFGRLDDNGGIDLHDGERWFFALADKTMQAAPPREVWARCNVSEAR